MPSGLRGKARPGAGAPPFGRPRWLAIATDRITADADEAALIRGAQVYAIVRLTPLAMAAASFNAVVLLAAFAALGALRPIFWIWAAAIASGVSRTIAYTWAPRISAASSGSAAIRSVAMASHRGRPNGKASAPSRVLPRTPGCMSPSASEANLR